ncbi:MAG: LemA family protein [bacterium]
MHTMLIILAIVVILVIFVVGGYNKLVSLKNTIDNATSDMDVQMKMRFDLVENLVNTVKGYASHEKGTLEDITNARTSFLSASSPAEKDAANTALAGSLKSLFAVAENYPDLKANTNFLQLQTELASIEDKIASSRRYYNATIKEYNTALMSFPSNIIAKMFGFSNQVSYFAAANDAERQAPKVDFSK